MTPCVQTIAAGIALDCEKALTKGWTGRAVYIPWSVNPALSVNAGNPRIISSVGTPSTVVGIYLPTTDPFNGSSVAGNADNSRVMYTKNFAVLVPAHGADVAKNTIEPLMKSAEGGIIIAERKDKRGLGSYVMIGVQDPAKVDPASYSRNETDNGGAAAMTFTCVEDFEEYNFFDTDYATTKAAFDALFTAAI